MHTIKRTAGDILEVSLSGRVTTDDYEAVIPAVESSIERQREVRLLCDISDLEALEPPTIWTDVVFDARHGNEGQRIAIVAAERWRRWAARLFKASHPTSVHVFDPDRHDVARSWVRGDMESGLEQRPS